jgi:SPP1 family predicted phage head-tail adaptor
MRSGKLDRRITLQTLTISRDGYGATIETWTDLDTVWAEVVPLKGTEYFAAAQIVVEEQLKFRIRYRSDLTEKVRITYNGQTYDVQNITEIGRRQGLELLGKRP